MTRRNDSTSASARRVDDRDRPLRDRHGRTIPPALAAGYQWRDSGGQWFVRLWVDELWMFRLRDGEWVPHRSLTKDQAMEIFSMLPRQHPGDIEF